jgi:hypothetical protein
MKFAHDHQSLFLHGFLLTSQPMCFHVERSLTTVSLSTVQVQVNLEPEEDQLVQVSAQVLKAAPSKSLARGVARAAEIHYNFLFCGC